MSVFLKGTKISTKPKKDNNSKIIKKKSDNKSEIVKENDSLTNEQTEALQNGDAVALQQLNPMIIPDYFNNIRNNYYVANKIIWLTGFIEWPIITEVMRRLSFYDDGTKEPITLYISSPGGECDARLGIN